MQENQENKKNGPVDYSKFFEQERGRPKTEEVISNKERKSFLNNLKIFWIGPDKKTKIQIIVFLAIIFLIIIILSSYWQKSKPKEFEGPIIPVSSGEGKIF